MGQTQSHKAFHLTFDSAIKSQVDSYIYHVGWVYNIV